MPDVVPPWLAPLTDAEHQLVMYGLVVTGLALLATLVRVRFTSAESHGEYRTASLTANAVVALAFVSYVLVAAAVLLGYHRAGGLWRPGASAELAWSIRYMDWTATVPLLVIELVAVSAVLRPRATQLRVIGMTAAALMVVLGFLGAIIVDDGRSFAALAWFGAASALCFAVLYALVLGLLVHGLPRLPPDARGSFRGAIVLLVIVWLAYPIVYGIGGVASGGAWATTSQLVLCAADMVAKIGFGTLIHRTAVLRSRADEQAQPGPRRPRQPEADSVWVGRSSMLEPELEPVLEDRPDRDGAYR